MIKCLQWVAFVMSGLLGFALPAHADDQIDLGAFELAQAVSEEPVEGNDRLGVIGQAVDYVDGTQAKASERFGNFMAQVDGFFGDPGTNDDAVSNQSWARIRLDAEKPGGEDFDIGPSLKLRAVLPQTEQRFKLLFSTEDNDTEQVGDSVEPDSASSGSDDQNASLAIRFIRTARDTGGLSFDLGIRQRDSKVQLFGRINTKFKGQIAGKWIANVANNYYYFTKSGFENKLAFDFRRPLLDREDFFFRSKTQFSWRKRQKGSIIGQTFGFYKQFGPKKSFALETLAGYHTALNTDIDDRFRGHEFRIRWRHSVWRPWFFYEFWPAVSWYANNDYEKAYGALVRLEVVIGQQ